MYQVQISLIGGPDAFNVKNMIVLLVGRGQTAENILHQYNNEFEGTPLFEDAVLIAIQPLEEWYPCPNGIDDQEAALEGLKAAIPKLNQLIYNFQNQFNLSQEQTALIGFSAGAVMALQLVANSNSNYAACVSHAGAILEPADLPKAKNSTPILLIHSENDDCFEWEERYLPMKKALIEQGYKVITEERDYGGHYMMASDAEDFLKKFLSNNDTEHMVF